MNKFKIPKSFLLFGNDISVIYDEDKVRELEALAACDSDLNRIMWTDKGDKGKLPKDFINQTFLHELVHMILFKLGEKELARNEKLVDLTAQALYQYFKTAKY